MGKEGFGGGVGSIIADPDFEQVAEDIERTGPAGRAVQIVDQEPDGLRPTGIEMQVGDQVGDRITQG